MKTVLAGMLLGVLVAVLLLIETPPDQPAPEEEWQPREQVREPVAPDAVDESTEEVSRSRVAAEKASSPTGDVAWHEDEAALREAQEHFAQRIAGKRQLRIDGVREQQLGTNQLRLDNAHLWHEVTEEFAPTHEDFKGLPEELIYGVVTTMREAAQDAKRNGASRVRGSMTPAEREAYDQQLVSEPLTHSPELVIDAYGGEQWREWPGFAEDFRSIRRRAFHEMAPYLWEIYMCEQEAVGTAYDLGIRDQFSLGLHLELMAPEVRVLRSHVRRITDQFQVDLTSLVSQHQRSD